MIETEQTVLIAAGIDAVWGYARSIERWAEIMPGYQSCEVLDADNSRWVLKVGVGGLVRTVKVKVHVAEWAGPERVDFTFKLEGDPVEGGGSYHAAPNGASTEVALRVHVSGSGPMAPMWEAMGGPLLPKFAKGFAEQLRDRIEAENPAAVARPSSVAPRPASPFARLVALLRSLLGLRSKQQAGENA